ncbi:MAG: DUF6491 family protein [Gammaproteobacteria bacterium]|nr:DUF6491 family protein [Gammaproteobacteria bacterium]
MKGILAVLMATLLIACASQPDTRVNDAVDDFIVVSELKELDTVRMREQFHYTELSEHYIILKTRKENYLVKFQRRCRELNEREVTPDIRFERNTLRAGFDTIRGCRIDRMYAIDKGQAQELVHLGKAPGEEG